MIKIKAINDMSATGESISPDRVGIKMVTSLTKNTKETMTECI